MPLSKYCKIYPSSDDPQARVLFSTQNASALLVPGNLIEDIDTGALSAEEKETLAGYGFFVRDAEEDEKAVLSYIPDINALDKALNYILVLNLDCNLACRYCFEGARKGRFYLSEEVEDGFVEFVKRSDLTGKKEIRITFYGGEPLLSTERIISISEKIRSFADRRGLLYNFSLVTNGTLLTARVVDRLVPLGLKSAKVTLDGPGRVHDMFRPFKSGARSFDTIVRNMKDSCEKISLQLGGNYTREHFQEFPLLLDHLAGLGLTPGKLAVVKFDPVINETSEFAPPDFHDGCESVNEPWISEAGLFLREEILRRGYATQKIMPSPCLIERSSCIVVNYDGALYKCPGLIGRKNCCVGDVRTGLIDYRGSHCLDAWKNEECIACSYLPLCFGGCKYMKLLRSGDMQGINCQKEYFDRTLGQLISQDIRYAL